MTKQSINGVWVVYNSIFKKIWHLACSVDSTIEPIPLSRDELSNQYSSLASEIRTYGIRIA